MTRINCIPVSELVNAHLVAEYRELPRAFKFMFKAQLRDEPIDHPNNPTEYTLGRGHIRFFYDKGLYLVKRQRRLVAEMQKRAMNPKFLDPWSSVPDGMSPDRMKDWIPTEQAMAINRARIAQRLAAMA